MACMWRQFARGRAKKPPQDVPPGHLAVKVGEASKRFVIRADYLNHPVIRQLLDQAYEENVHNKSGPLAIPCDECLFEDIIQSLGGSNNESQFTCHGAVEKLGLSSLRDSIDHFFKELQENQHARDTATTVGEREIQQRLPPAEPGSVR